MMVAVEQQVRSAVQSDHRQLSNLIHFSPFVHRHLDWRYPLDWIGAPPFYVLETQGQISAVLACPPDPPRVAWVRLFISSGRIPLSESWHILWDAVRPQLSRIGGITVAAIVLQDWLPELLLPCGFTTRQSIVMLEREGGIRPDVALPPGISIRPMESSDLPAVAQVDASAFEPLWQNSFQALELAFPQAVSRTVAEVEGRVMGYQISTRNPSGAHLARLAVDPSLQGRGVGRALVADLIQETGRHGMARLTVNTQSDNFTSLALYTHIGFRETGERFPVYQYPAGAPVP